MTTTLASFTGVIDSVRQVILGSVLATDAAVNDTVLNIVDISDFSDSGTISLNGVLMTWIAVDTEAQTITLSTPLAAAALQDDEVWIWDAVNSVAATEVRAKVSADQQVDGGEATDARVALAVVPLLPIGDRDPGAGEVATVVEEDEGIWVLTDLPGVTPQVRGELVAPGSLQQASFGFTFGNTKVTIGSVDPQTIATPNDGDIWYDANNDYQMKQWSAASSAWAPYQLGNNALASAAASRTFIGSNAPTSPRDSDLWIYVDNNGGMQMNRWDVGTSAWVPLVFNTDAIAAAKIIAGMIDVGVLTALTISAGTYSGSITTSAIDSSDFIIDDSGGRILIYQLAAGAQTVVNITTIGSGGWVVPAGVTQIKVECWGGGEGGNSAYHWTSAGGGCLGGEGGVGGGYARNNAMTVVPGSTIPYNVGGGGAGGASNGLNGAPGGDTWFSSATTLVGAGGGTGALNGSVSGTGPIRFSSGVGGDGYTPNALVACGGGGGGEAACSTANGHSGSKATGALSASGGSGGGDGGNGGPGGNSVSAGGAGTQPGGGGGGGGAAASGTTFAGGNGGAGKIKVTYNAPGGLVLVGSIASASGTDQYGNTYPAGMRNLKPSVGGYVGGYYEEVNLSGVSILNNTNTTLTAFTASKLMSDTGSAFNLTTGIWTCPKDGVYTFTYGVAWAAWVTGSRCRIYISRNGTAAANAFIGMDSNALGASATLSVSGRKWMNANDQVNFRTVQASGATQVIAVDDRSYISIQCEA